MKAHRRYGWILFIAAVVMLGGLLPTAYAADDKTEVNGKVYEFEADCKYEFSNATKSETTEKYDTYGQFFVSGIIDETATENGIPAYRVDNGNLEFHYSYTDVLLNADEDTWHLAEDKCKKIDAFSLDSYILKGAIVVQISNDRKNWLTVKQIGNAFSDDAAGNAAIYSTEDIQLINGCYYRIIVTYKLTKRISEDNFLFVDTSKYESRRVAEVYEFYAYSSDAEITPPDPRQKYELGNAVRTEKFDGYVGEAQISKGDPHYGVTLGRFYVSGYTDKKPDANGNMVFLKNVGDKVVLWFNLVENIDAIEGNPKIKITADKNGSDQYFQTKPTDFGRGTLIIRYTDYNNNSTEPQIYTNYLEANATIGADAKVRLFEEGDYEVALDYEITTDKTIDSKAHYRIFFKFSIRNSNCMVFPFDVKTGDELTNSSMTKNGFRLDLANSRYLTIIVKREMLTQSADGLVEDTRFNGSAKDGAEYTEDGIYTITATNKYTNQLTVKKIYVGTNNVLRAYMTTGLSIPEINNLIARGATIADDGTILMPTDAPIVTEKPVGEQKAASTPTPNNATENEQPAVMGSEVSNVSRSPLYIGIGAALIVAVIGVLIFAEKNRKTVANDQAADAAVTVDTAAEKKTEGMPASADNEGSEEKQ